ncbi:hypothetical protein C2W62_38000 [Candidatus Entotheonella serta]|nr:hypothetical protein C2W62_38000 [Candidatus Entotheonella serta]
MWMMCARIVTLIAGLMLIIGCGQDITRVRIEMQPNQGCAPLKVSLVGAATVRDGVDVGYRWAVNGEVLPNRDRVEYAFSRPGTYEIAFTVSSEQQEKTETAMLNVSEAPLPNEPGVYQRLDCGYQALAAGREQTQTVSLGKTSLEDLEKIMGRKLSTPELVLHPLWRREHTHTTHTVERSQFSEVALDHFLQSGFITVGQRVGEATLFKVVPNAEPKTPDQIVTRMIDSWGQASVEPEMRALKLTELTPEIMHYLPLDALTDGLYFISVTSEEDAPPAIRPLALVAADR